MRILTLLLTALLLEGAVTIKTVRSSGGTHAGTLAGLQSAVDECRALDSTDPCIVEIEAGLTLSNGSTCFLVLAAQSEGPKLIVIRSSRISELPENVRVTEADASKLAKIQNSCASSQAVILVPPEITGNPGAGVASHYLLQGLDVHFSGEGRNAGGAINIGYDPDSNMKAKSHWQAPHTITVDRCWAHGNDTETWITASSTHANQSGIRVDGRNITVKNSRFSDNNQDSVDHGAGESKGISTSNGPGPLYVYNNYIDGAIGSLIGGEWTWIPGLVLTGAWFYGNEYARNPWAWHWLEWDTTDTLNASEPCVSGSFWEQKVAPLNKWKCVGGSWQTTTDNRVNRTWTKNAWECKNCRMAFVEGNYIHDLPSTGDQSQWGYAFLINNVDAADYAYWARPESISIRYNRAQRTGQGPTLGWGGDTKGYKRTNNVTIENNVFENLAGARVSPTQGTQYSSGGGAHIQVSGLDMNLRIAKNTFIYDRTFGGAGVRLSDTPPVAYNVYLQDNILPWASLGQSPIDNTNEACAALRGVMSGAVYWDYFGLVDTNSRGSSAFTTLFGGSGCPANVSRAADVAAVKFVDANNGDFRLCTGTDTPETGCTTSPWATSASDGGPLGADAAQVAILTDDAEAGTYDPSKYGVQIHSASPDEVRYTPRTATGTCTGTVTTPAGGAVDSMSDSGAGGMSRTWEPTIASNGEYIVRITCGGVWREARIVRAQ